MNTQLTFKVSGHDRLYMPINFEMKSIIYKDNRNSLTFMTNLALSDIISQTELDMITRRINELITYKELHKSKNILLMEWDSKNIHIKIYGKYKEEEPNGRIVYRRS